MKIKKLIRFYFFADSLERALGDLIVRKACASMDGDGQTAAELLCSIIEDKIRLENLWAYLDDALGDVTDAERVALVRYAQMRELHFEDEENRLTIKRAIMKFKRRLRKLAEFESELIVLDKYACLLRESSGSGA